MTKEYSTRASFSLPPRLLQELDEVAKIMGYGERSRTIQMAMRDLITQSKLSASDKALAVGTIIVLYDHEKKGTDERLTDIGHNFTKSIITTLHVHLDKEQCLSIIVAKCEIRTMLLLQQRLRGIAGVTQVKFSYMVPTLEGSNWDFERACQIHLNEVES